jgi:WD40 repeat protein
VVADVTFLPAGDRLLSASVDASMRVWDLDGGLAMDTLTTRMPSPFAAVAPDGDRLAAGGAGRVVRLWPLDDLSGDSRVLTRHDRTVTGVAFSPCGDRVASVGLDGRLRIARLADGEGACP